MRKTGQTVLLKGNFICRPLTFFSKSTFSKNLSGIPSECQTVWIQNRPDALSGLVWVQAVCKGYQQMTLLGKELKDCAQGSNKRNIGLFRQVHMKLESLT